MAKNSSTVTLSWKNPSDADLNKVVIAYGSNGKKEVFKSASPNNSVDITGLTAGDKVLFAVRAVDNAGNESDGVTVYGFPNDVYSLHTEPVKNGSGNGSTAIFGDWPQTAKDEYVDITSTTKTIAGMTCYLGNDNNYYAKVTGSDVYESGRHYLSNGETASTGSTYYVKIEPISWVKHGPDYYYSEKTLFGHPLIDSNSYLQNTFKTAFDGTTKAVSPSLPQRSELVSSSAGFSSDSNQDSARMCEGTDYAVLTGGYKNSYGYSWWWVSDGNWVTEDGKVSGGSSGVGGQSDTNTSGTVRVVMYF